MKPMKLSRNMTALFGAVALLWIGASGLLFSQTVTTVAGGYLGDGGKATNAAFNFVLGIAQDKNGNYYVSDPYGQRIRKISTSGNISTYAGTGIAGYNGDGISASTAQLYFPAMLVFDTLGNLIVADGGNCRVRKIDTSGMITTIAGNGACGYSGDGGPATSASFGQAWGLAYDGTGNLYISDFTNNVVRKVNTSGNISTFAGNGIAGYGGDGGPATKAELSTPSGLVADTSGNIYIADRFNSRVRKVDTTGTITTFAGNGMLGHTGDGGPATSATIGLPRGLAIKNGVIFIGNGGGARVRSVNISTNIIQTYAGSSFGYDGDGHSLTTSQFARPTGIIFNSAGTMVVADTSNGRLRKGGATMSTVAGGYLGDGTAANSVALVEPEAVAFDKSNNYYIADSNGNRIRKVSATTGKISTVAGTGISGYTGDGGKATAAQLWYPFGVAVDSSGNIFIADNSNNVIRKVDNSTGNISTFASDANFSSLGEIKLDSANNLYVADDGSCVVFKITPAAVVSIIAGVPFVCGYNGDHIPATTAQLNTPYGLAFDSSGALYIADSTNNRVRKVNTAGTITTIAGDGNCNFSGDGGPATSAELCFPQDVILNSGVTYIADTGNVRIRKISGGIINTYAGTGAGGYNGDGLGALSTNLDDPVALAKDSHGTIFELDDVQTRLRKVH